MVHGDELLLDPKERITNHDQRLDGIKQRNLIDAKFGYQLYTEGSSKNAWLVNVQQSEVLDETTKTVLAAVDLYFLEEIGTRFKISYLFRPYFFLEITHSQEFAIASYLSRKYHFLQIDHVEKENLDLKNHLSGLKSRFLRLSFPSTLELGQLKKELMPQIRKNRQNMEKASDYATILTEYMSVGPGRRGTVMLDDGPLEQIVDIREHDLPFDMRVCIDQGFFVGHWYSVVGRDLHTQKPKIWRNHDFVEPPEPVICAFDIETTKAPLKFPEPNEDQIMMISYMVDGNGFLLINREIVAADIANFEYTPRPEFRGEFHVFNEPNERSVLIRFFDHLIRVKPNVMVTYNGDFFDWPFVDARAKIHDISLQHYLGFYKDSQDEYKHNNCIHMDAFKWVQRDSYLPMGSQSLKAATREKLRYDPVEIDPEEMVPMARHEPMKLANYSVSDAVATYYLYIKYVHPFIFALCTIIPLCPDDVLRKGSGTLCEALLMVQAHQNNIIFPNKQVPKEQGMTADGHLIDSETYVGGHVEALESGVFRADIACRFKLDLDTLKELKEDIRPTMEHSLSHDSKVLLTEVCDFVSVCAEIELSLDALIDKPLRTELPRLYHLDVGAMYPNIILTNRLQPPAMVTEEDCMACVHNAPEAKCKRAMDWIWRGEFIPAKKGEYDRLMLQLEQEKFGKPPRPFNTLPREEKAKIAKKRIQDYCRTAYKRLHDTREERRTSTICQREHPFYVDTVRAFRDRRYEYKEMHKKARIAAEMVPADDLVAKKQAQARVVLYDSLQMAHKCILNSFYGYVMRKGSRWFSMEMAGIVCHTGANIITEARQLVERIGRPLELDTDGIWCMLPSSFPDNFVFHTTAGKSIKVNYPGAVLNALVKDRFTNDQYHTVDPTTGACTIESENSIFFEVDGPYYAMILPASKEEGKKLKKRYAVFNFDKTLAELKGFEVKRRGELALIKYFQSEVFKAFLEGGTLEAIYAKVAKEADYWLDILYDRGKTLSTRELFELIGESKNMSRTLEDYGEQKSTSITTAKRLAEFLGEAMTKNKGLACKFIVSRFPLDEPVTGRTIPLAIFEAEPKVRAHYLRKWTKGETNGLDKDNEDCLRELIDWQYYIDRLGSCIQKIVTIPAALQGLSNPVPRVPHPQWLENKRKERVEMHVQPRITDLFKNVSSATTPLRRAGGRVGLSPWSLKNDRSRSAAVTSAQLGGESSGRKRTADSDATTPARPPKQLSMERNKTVPTRIRMVTSGNEEEGNAEGNERHGHGNQIGEGELIALDQFEMIGECWVGLPVNNVSAAGAEQLEATTSKTSEIEEHQRQRRDIGPARKKNKKVLLRESKRLAVLQHAKRRFPRAYYNEQLGESGKSKRSWRDHDGDFLNWLNHLKVKWRLQLRARADMAAENCDAQRQLEDTINANVGICTSSFYSHQNLWHILQILETKIPGKFTVFALVNGGTLMRRVNLTVPRTIFVDDIEPRQTAIGRLTQKLLPKMRPCGYLYEFHIDEAMFAAKMSDLNMEMCLMRINGIYETKVPLLFKAVAHAGVICKVAAAQRNAISSGELTLDSITRLEDDPLVRPLSSIFDRRNASSDFYTRLRLYYFYEYFYSGRTVFSLFIPSVGKAFLFVVNRSSVDLMNLDNMYQNELAKLKPQKGDDGAEEYLRELEEFKRIGRIEAIQCTSIREAARRLQIQLNGMKLASTDPSLLCLKSNRPLNHLFKDFPVLRAFPFMQIQGSIEPPNLMNALDWANALARRSVKHFFNCFSYIKEYFAMSTYLEIPIGNLSEDVPSLALDALFTRHLDSKNFLLWASPSPVPDFGGKDLEDLRLANDWENASFTDTHGHLLNRESFEHTYTAELSLGAVAVTALLQSARIAESEGTSEYAEFGAACASALSIEDALSHRFGLTKYDDGISVNGELKCLREMFHDLVRDIHLHKSVIADQLVLNLHRWLCDPNSLLFNPAIRNTLSTLMRKLCLLLVADIQRLGATVLHCSFTRLVLSTNKKTFSQARTFLDSLLLSISRKPMFASLQINVQNHSSILLWIDSANYSRVFASDDPNTNGRVQSQFALADRIPEERGIRTFFRTMIAGFMGMLSKRRSEECENPIVAEIIREEEVTSAFEDYAVHLFDTELADSLLKLVNRLVASRTQLLSKLAHDNDCVDIALEFVNCACRVLNVIPVMEERVEEIRSQLFAIIRQDESVNKSDFLDWTPPSTVLLEEIFCPRCFQSSDIDINQKPTNIQREEADLSVQHPFVCSHCFGAYPISLIEEILLERISRMQIAFTLQDWRCKSCKKIGINSLARYCECNNKFEGTIKPNQLRLNLSMVQRLATRYKLTNLEQAIGHILHCHED